VTFVRDAAAQYRFDAANVVAAGFSNGANIAASMLLLDDRGPEGPTLRGAILFRAMVPIVPEPLPDLSEVRILMSNGRLDTLIPAAQAQQLAGIFEKCGADVRLEWQPGGHNLTKQDVAVAREWIISR
jgi:predicted esterase